MPTNLVSLNSSLKNLYLIIFYAVKILTVNDLLIHKDTINTRSTVPGQIVIKVFSTNLRNIIIFHNNSNQLKL